MKDLTFTHFFVPNCKLGMLVAMQAKKKNNNIVNSISPNLPSYLFSIVSIVRIYTCDLQTFQSNFFYLVCIIFRVIF